jgi:hypothetical protein
MYLSDEIYNFDPAYAYYNASARNIVSLLFETLFKLDSDGKIQNGLVDEYEYIENPSKDEYKLVMTLLAIGCVVVALFGKKMIGFLKFVFFFVIGFALGTHLLTPIISEAVEIPGWIVGTVVALVSAVLYRFLYIVLYSAVAGYGMYILAYHGFYIQGESNYSNGKAIGCLVAAAIAIAVALIFKKYIEMIGTAVLGGWLSSWIIANFVYNFTTFPIFGGITWVAILVPAVIIAALGAVVQIKTRRRY